MWDTANRMLDAFEKTPHLPLRFAGFGMLQMWGCYTINLLADSSVGMGILSASSLYQDMYVLTQIVVLLFVALAAPRLSPYCNRDKLLSASVILSLISTVVMLLGLWFALAPWLVGLIAIMAGLAYGYLFMMWAELLGCLSGAKMIVAYLMATISYYIVATAIHYIDNVLSCIIYALVLLLAIVPLFMAARSIGEENLPKPMTGRLNVPWQIIVFVLIFSIVFDMSGGFVMFSKTGVMLRLGRLIPILVILFLALFDRKFDFPRFYNFIIVLMILGLVVTLFVDRSNLFAQICVQAGAESYSFLLFVIVCSYAYRLRISSTAFYGIVAALNLLVQFAGEKFVASFPGVAQSSVFSIVICIIGILVLLLLVNRTSLVNLIQPLPPERKSKAATVEQFAKAHNLSPQEKMVLDYVVDDQSTNQIADALFISQSTVRVHLSTIYRKVGVHGRDDLMAAIAQEA